MHLKIPFAKWRLFRLGRNELTKRDETDNAMEGDDANDVWKVFGHLNIHSKLLRA